MSAAWQATCVAISGRGLMIEGSPGSGKSSLALALIDRGARLVGDDGVLLSASGGRLKAGPHPNTRGLLEVRNLGLFDLPCTDTVEVGLVIVLEREAPRYIEAAEQVERHGIAVPMVRLWPDSPVLALRAELALTRYGLA